MQDAADRLQVWSRHQIMRPHQAVHQSSPRLGKIRCP